MAKKSTARKPIKNETPGLPPGVTAENLPNLIAEMEKMENSMGVGAGLGSFNPFNMPGQGNGFPGTEQLSSVNTIFKNLRWYLISNFRQVLCQAYVELGLVQTIVDLPVDDGLRGGVEIKSSQLDEDQIAELQVSLDRDDDLNTAGHAGKWNRLFGGGGILILTDQDPETELDVNAITNSESLEFRDVDLWELFWTAQNTEGYDPTIQENDFEFYNYYGENVHKSRVIRLKGRKAPSFIRPRLRGWGFSVVEQLVRSINQYLKATDLGFEVLDEFKVDVFKIKNIVNTLLSPNGMQKIQSRVQWAAWMKNYQNALVMDSEDDFDHKQLSFSGLAETMEGIRMQVAADMRIPRSKLFGEAGSGLNNGANEGDLEVYNSMVEAEVRTKLKYPILRMIELKCQKMFGFIPDDLSISFKPLRILSGVDEETVKTQKFSRLKEARAMGEITRLEFRDGLNRGGLLDITLDNSGDELNPDDPDIEEVLSEGEADEEVNGIDQEGDADEATEGENNPKKPKDSADQKDTKKAKVFKEGGGEYGGEKQPKKEKPNKPLKNYGNQVLLPRYTFMERSMRSLMNSADFDRAAYESDDGDDWIADGRKPFFEDPRNVDKALWAAAKRACAEAMGEDNWKFVVWWYKKQGGKFQ